MPLSEPVPRKQAHGRVIECAGYRREDGLWDIEGQLTDTKTYRLDTGTRSVHPGEPVHRMLVRLTVDDDYTVVAIECATDGGPHPTCGAIIPNFQRIVGQKIGPGWTKRVKALVGGAEGCAHHVELIGLLATVAFQTMGHILAQSRGRSMAAGNSRPFLINSCHLWREDGPLARMDSGRRPDAGPPGKG